MILIAAARILLCGFVYQVIASDAATYCPLPSEPMEVYRCKCYQFVTTEMYWPNAHDYCTLRGGQLIDVIDGDKSAWLSKQLDRKFYLNNGVWIGLQYNSGHRDWTWRSGLNLTAAGYANWASMEPNRLGLLGFIDSADCAMASRVDGWRWRAKLCAVLNWKYVFVCQYSFRDNLPCDNVDPNTGELSIEAIIGIVVGAIVGFILLSLLLCWLLCLVKSTACDWLKVSQSRRRARARSGRSSSARTEDSRSAAAGLPLQPSDVDAYAPHATHSVLLDEAAAANNLNEQFAASQPPRRPDVCAGPSANAQALNVDAAATDVELQPLKRESLKIRNDGSRNGSKRHGGEDAGGSRRQKQRQEDGGGDSSGSSGVGMKLKRTVSIEDNTLAVNADIPYEKEQFTRSLQHLDKA